MRPESTNRSYSGYSESLNQHPYQPETSQDEFDVRADFDGNGPRWSDVYGTIDGKGDTRR